MRVSPVARTVGLGLGFAAFLSMATTSHAAEISLAHPVDCTLGQDCWVQNLVDTDPGPTATDFRCTSFTYDTHSGTDIRIANRHAVNRGVAALAVAPGKVLRMRDGEPDRIYDQPPPDRKGRDCGNGLIIDHGGGYETQYCHLRKGSVIVQPGQEVERGEPLGMIGTSGKTDFAHLHITLRKDGETIDPYTSARVGASACGEAGTSLWEESEAMMATIDAQVINAGFAAGAVEMEAIEEGHVPLAAVPADAPALVFFGRAANLLPGDVQRITVSGPGFEVEDSADPLPRKRAQAMIFAGKRLRGERWEAGRYEGTYEVLRDGEVLDSETVTVEIE